MFFISAEYEIEAWVADARRFNEHRQEQKDDEKSGKAGGLTEGYLECEEGQAFKIRWRVLRCEGPRPDIRISANIDGREIAGKAMLGKDKDPSGDIASMCVDQGGVKHWADLAFAAMPKTDEESEVQVRGEAVSELCKIEITMRQGRYVQSRGGFAQTTSSTGIGKVHEKQLKLGSTVQGTNLRVATPSGQMFSFTPAAVDPDICRFLWNYHTRTALNLRGITQEEPVVAEQATVNPKREREDGDRPSGEIKRVKTEGAKVKMEKNGQGSKNKPILISDFDSPKKASSSARGVIDLTDD